VEVSVKEVNAGEVSLFVNSLSRETSVCSVQQQSSLLL
jgi:hypothetical protein